MESFLEYQFKDSFWTNIIRILPNSSLTLFYNRLELFLSIGEVFDLVLEDFNINALATGNNLRSVLSKYQLLNHDPTHIRESLLPMSPLGEKQYKDFL